MNIDHLPVSQLSFRVEEINVIELRELVGLFNMIDSWVSVLFPAV